MRDPLIVFDSHETSFRSNGLRILSPTVAEHTLEFGQAGSIHVEHPIDEDGDWKALLPGNIILAPVELRGKPHPQPFRIYRRTKKRQDGSLVVAVDALHCFYDLNYVLLEDVRPTDLNGQDAIQGFCVKLASQTFRVNLIPRNTISLTCSWSRSTKFSEKDDNRLR